MRSRVVAVGRAGAGPHHDLFQDYARRLRPALALVEVEERRKLPTAQRRDREAELLLAATPSGSILVALDMAGQMLSTEQFAGRVADWRDGGASELVFLIGGADGHGAAIGQRADCLLSLGPMVWPHLLVRVLIAEQLYRAVSLLAGHPYHRG